MAAIQKISACLWFDTNAEAAVNFYMTVFQNASIKRISRYGNEGQDIHGMADGTVMTIEFEIEGQQFTALNGGPIFKFNESVSLMINCESQQEIDYYWEKLTAGGDPLVQQCGWLKDKFGLSWQVTPIILAAMVTDSDKAKTERVMRALMPMKKLDIAALQKAFDGH